MFIKRKDEFILAGTKTDEAVASLDAGVYNMRIERSPFTGTSVHLEKNTNYENKEIINCGVFKEVDEYINNFYDKNTIIARKALKQKNTLGLIFSGIPGTGKTFLAGQLGERLAKMNDAITIMTSDFDIDLSQLIKDMREAEGDERQLVLIIDEFEKSYDRRHCSESEFLSFMDGPHSRENILVLATVNNHSKLPDTITKRPGRFERIFHFKNENTEVVTKMIEGMVPEKYSESLDIPQIATDLVKAGKHTVDYILLELRGIIGDLLSGKCSYMKNVKAIPQTV